MLFFFRLEYDNFGILTAKKEFAANVGTSIIIYDLFFNLPIRKNCLSSPYEEHKRILDLAQKYSIHYAEKVCFFCTPLKQKGLINQGTDKVTHIKNYTSQNHMNILKEIASFTEYSFEVLFSDFSTNLKDSHFIFFVNNRLVEWIGLKKSLTEYYYLRLLKGTFPFVYCSIIINPNSLDVNAHPTKERVVLQNEEILIKSIIDRIDKKMKNNSPKSIFIEVPTLKKVEFTPTKTDICLTPSKRQYSDPKVRNFNFFKYQKEAKTNVAISKNTVSLSDSTWSKFAIACRKKADSFTTEIISNHIWVGLFDDHQALIQHKISLYIVNIENLLFQYFYQFLLYSCNNSSIHTAQLEEKICLNNEHIPAACLNNLKEFGLSVEENNFINYPIIPGIEVDSVLVSECIRKIISLCVKNDLNENTFISHLLIEFSNMYLKCSISCSVNREDYFKNILFEKLRRPSFGFSSDINIVKLTDIPTLYKTFERC